ncbi:MAG: hypothetical protein HQL71_09970 [Magnetococcales bacterium]|nr:hypothetical protein [Magnetococcales bacterium]
MNFRNILTLKNNKILVVFYVLVFSIIFNGCSKINVLHGSRCIKGDCVNGEGVLIDSNGKTKYSGRFLGGWFTKASGATIEDGKPDGRNWKYVGNVIYMDRKEWDTLSQQYTYRSIEPSGYGVIKHYTGSDLTKEYKGYWKEGMKHGKGVETSYYGGKVTTKSGEW